MSAAAYLFALPTVRPLTAAGAIMPNAYIQFYAAGTTTPADVYADAGLTTPLTNPVVANSAGEFVPIYLDPATVYRVLLYDADDVLIRDTDPYLPDRDYPPGTILMFYGTEAELEAAYPPALWQQLNGNNGAPDIRDRMPIGVSASLSPGDTGGGSGTVNTTAAGAHDHGAATGSHTLTTDEIPSHGHNVLDRGAGTAIADGTSLASTQSLAGIRNVVEGSYITDNSLGTEYIEPTGGGTGHTHSITAAADHTHQVTVTPPYCALWFIMRRDV